MQATWTWVAVISHAVAGETVQYSRSCVPFAAWASLFCHSEHSSVLVTRVSRRHLVQMVEIVTSASKVFVVDSF